MKKTGVKVSCVIYRGEQINLVTLSLFEEDHGVVEQGKAKEDNAYWPGEYLNRYLIVHCLFSSHFS